MSDVSAFAAFVILSWFLVVLCYALCWMLCVDRSVSQDVVEAVNLLAQGKRNYMCGEVGHAVNQLQEACRLLYEFYCFFYSHNLFSE